jgi:hypothetical protein
LGCSVDLSATSPAYAGEGPGGARAAESVNETLIRPEQSQQYGSHPFPCRQQIRFASPRSMPRLGLMWWSGRASGDWTGMTSRESPGWEIGLHAATFPPPNGVARFGDRWGSWQAVIVPGVRGRYLPYDNEMRSPSSVSR